MSYSITLNDKQKMTLKQAYEELMSGNSIESIIKTKSELRYIENTLDILLGNIAQDIRAEGTYISPGWTYNESILIVSRLSNAHIKLLNYVINDPRREHFFIEGFANAVKDKSTEVLFEEILLGGEKYGS